MAKSRSVGTKFYVDEACVGSLTSINAPELTSETTDVTALDNADGYKEFLGGFKDGGEVSLEGFFDGDNEGQTAMHAAFEDPELHDCRIVFPDAIGKTWNFKGVITKFNAGNAAINDALKFSAGVKVSGKPSLDATAQAAQVNAPAEGGEG